MDMGAFFNIIKYYTLLARNVNQEKFLLAFLSVHGMHVFAPVLVIN